MNEYENEFKEDLQDIIKEAESEIIINNAPEIDEVTPYWAKDIKKESMEKALLAGNILPELKMRAGTIYTVKIASEIKPILSAKGNFDVIDVERDGLNMSLKANKSFQFNLEKERIRYKLKYSELIGKKMIIQKDEKGFVVVQLKI